LLHLLVSAFPAPVTSVTRFFTGFSGERAMTLEAIANAPHPVLAAGWAFLYLLFGGGLGGAVLLFFGLKALGH
jgi:hypothetical protein